MTVPTLHPARAAIAAIVAALLLPTPAVADDAPPADAAETYVVQVDPGQSAAVADTLTDLGVDAMDPFGLALDGFAVELTPDQVEAVAALPAVTDVSVENVFTIADTQDSPPWGLDRLDQVALPLNGRYVYRTAPGAGTGVRVYVMDTGISAHSTFAGRLATGYTAVGDGNGTTDCNGHGTHVAGTVASTRYGVAKGATLVPVRVLDCAGNGNTTTVVTGLDWILAHHPVGTPGVVNMSLGGPRDNALNAAIGRVNDAGLVVTAAAGNENLDACTTSPASAPPALTTGATGSNDVRAEFSNWGPCLDLFAPGAWVESTSADDPNGSEWRSGTSMASPHVAGVAALYLSVYPNATPAQITAAVLSATTNVVDPLATGTTTSLLTSLLFPTPGAPEDVRVTASTLTGVTVAWTAPAGTPATGYQVSYTCPGQPMVTLSTVATTLALTGLTPATTYQVTVTATNANGSGISAAPVAAATLAPPQAYIVNVYGDLFDRAPDPTGLSGWTAALAGGVPRNAVADAITSSPEYRSGLITESYVTYLGRSPDPQGLAGWLRAMNAGLTIQQMESGFIASDEYYARAGGTSTGWVRALYRDVLNRDVDEGEAMAWVAALGRGVSRSQVAMGFLLSSEHLSTVINGHYLHLLGRGLDPTGQAGWVGAIQRGIRIEVVIGSIIASDEYWANSSV